MNCVIYGLPLLILIFLAGFAAILWYGKGHSKNGDRGQSTKDHSERIYKDFEMYLKVVLGLTAAFGYVRLNKFDPKNPDIRHALIGVGAISLFVMWIFCVFIICHMGSKLRRWQPIEWEKLVFWQELWACIAMFMFSSVMWIESWKW